MYCHGDPNPRPIKTWLIKGLIPAQGHGLLSGQWGTFKSFMALELSASVMTGQPFLDRLVKRQCGVLFLAAEGQSEMRPRLEALVREKCGGMARAPFRWFEDVPLLLQPDGLSLLVAMGKLAAESLQQEFGLPLGLVLIDTIAASAGFTGMGAENDNAINQRLMNVLRACVAANELLLTFWKNSSAFLNKDTPSNNCYDLGGWRGPIVKFHSGWNGSPVMSRDFIAALLTLMPFW